MPFGPKSQKKVEPTSSVQQTTQANDLSTISLIQRTSSVPNSIFPQNVMHLQRTIGNQAVSQLLGRGRSGMAPNADSVNRLNSARPLIQPKLKVGAANDKYEREAEQIAGSLDFSRRPSPVPVAAAPVAAAKQNGATVQRSSFAGAEGGAVDADLAGRIQRAQKGGSSLSSQVRSKIEPQLGADLSNVKVHTGDDAVQLTRELGAKAFTHQNHIYYGTGQSPNDLHLTTHEAVHTIQQGSVQQVQRKHDNGTSDSASTQMGDSIAVAQPPSIQRSSGPNVIQRIFGLSKKEKEAKRERKQKKQDKINDSVKLGSDYERRLGKYLFNHTKANTAAHTMLIKMRDAMIPEFNGVDEDHQRQIATQFGGTKTKYAGNVGREVADVMEVFEGGNLRERMTAFYNSMFGGFKQLVTGLLKTRDWEDAQKRGFNVTKLRTRSRQLGYSGFGKNIGTKKDSYNKNNKEIYRDPRNPLDRKKLRGMESGLLLKSTRKDMFTKDNEEVTRTNRTVGELDEGPHKAGLSERERRFMFGQKGVDEDVSGERLTWEEGGSRFKIKDNSSWVKRIRDQLHMPLTAGPSGTALRFFQIWEWLGKPVPAEDLRLALLGWMLVENDHSLHEIMSVAADYGLPYVPGQMAYKNISPLTIEELRQNVALDPNYPRLFPDEITYQKKMANGEFKLAHSDDLDAMEVTEQEDKWSKGEDAEDNWIKAGKESIKDSGKVTKAGAGSIKAYTGLAYLVQNPVLKKSPRFVKWLKVWYNLKKKNEMSTLREGWKAVGKADFTVSDLMAEAEEHNRMLHQALTEMPAWEGTVYRGGGVSGAAGKYPVGTEVTFNSFTSTSEKESTARSFANKAGSGTKVIFEIQVSNGRNISPLSLYPKGKEVLLPPGSKFKVSSAPEDYNYENPFTKRVEGRYLKIKMQQIG